MGRVQPGCLQFRHAALLSVRRPADRSRLGRVVPQPAWRRRPCGADRRGRRGRGRGRERPVPAAPAPGLAALPRPDRPRRLSRHLFGHRARHPVPRRARRHRARRRQHAQGDAAPSGNRSAGPDRRDRRQHAQRAPDAPQGLGLRPAHDRDGPARRHLPGRGASWAASPPGCFPTSSRRAQACACRCAP